MVRTDSATVEVVEIVGANGNPLDIEDNGSMPVTLQDSQAPLIIGYVSIEVASSTLSVAGAIDDFSITVADGSLFAVGQYLSIFSVPDDRFYLANILTKSVNVLGLDTPLDFAFPIGSFVTGGNKNLNVDGSVTPVIYGLRNTEEVIGTAFDITRIMFTCLTTNSNDLGKFGDIALGLTKGIVVRKKDGVYHNIMNAKTNGELKNLMFDFDIESAQNLQQGQNGFTGRLTFAGQNKMGAVVRLNPGEDIQVIIQDDLSTLLSFSVIAEGSEVI